MEFENSSNGDMSGMMAMMLQMLGDGEADGNGQASSEQAAKIRQAMEMAHMFQILSKEAAGPPSKEATMSPRAMGQAPDADSKEAADPPPDEDGTNMAASAEFFDMSILTPELVTIKSAIPHIERKYQKPLGILVKMIEMQRLMDFYGPKTGVHAMSADTLDADSGERKRKILSAIRFNTSDAVMKTKIDVLLKALDISELLLKVQNDTA